VERPVSDGAPTSRQPGSPPESAAAQDPAASQQATQTPHLILNPAWLPPAVGFAHVVIPAAGLVLYLGGQAGHRPDGMLVGTSVIDQLEQACRNVVEALAAAGAGPEHLVSLQIFVTDMSEYRSHLAEIGDVWERHFGRHYPAMALLEVRALFDPAAKVELMGVAVVPERPVTP
jgi:enamine deaminase RidA (YjgF/YER057c/UK114 family)